MFEKAVSRALWVYLLLSVVGCASIEEQQQKLDQQIEAYYQLENPTQAQRDEIKQELESTEHRSAWATAVLAGIYNHESATQEEKARVLPLYEQAIELGYRIPNTIAFVANQHLKGKLPNADRVKGLHYLRLAANLENEWAKIQMATLYMEGAPDIKLPPLHKNASHYIAADHTNFMAWHCLNIYSYRLSKTCVEYLLAAENDDHQSRNVMLGLGVIYANGWQVEPNEQLAANYYSKATELGLPQGRWLLTELYLNSDSHNEQQQGVALLQQIANQQDDYALSARARLAQYMFKQGQYSAAYEYASQAERSADVMYQLHQHYQQGLGVKADPDKAQAYLLSAANYGHTQAIFDLYSTAEIKESVRRRFIEIAAQNHNQDAAVWMKDKAKEQPDHEQYLVWLTEAALLGDKESQHTIAQYYQFRFSNPAYVQNWQHSANDTENNAAANNLSAIPSPVVPLPSGKLLDDGSFIIPEHHQLLPNGNNSVLQGNISHAWRTHCGWVIERKTGEIGVIVDTRQRDCIPSDQDLEPLLEFGVRDLTHNLAASAAILNNGQLISWGSRLMGGYLVDEALWQDKRAPSWEELLAIYHDLEKDVASVGAMESSLLAMTADGNIWQWGMNGGSYLVPGKYRQLLGGYISRDACGVTTTGGLNCWHQNTPTQPITLITEGVKTVRSAPRLGSGYGFVVMSISDDGQLSVWNIYYNMIDADQALMNDPEINSYTWSDLRPSGSKDQSMLATRSDGRTYRFYYPKNLDITRYRLER